MVTLRKELLALSRACGVPHPSLVSPDQIEMLDDRFGSKTVADVFGGRGLSQERDGFSTGLTPQLPMLPPQDSRRKLSLV